MSLFSQHSAHIYKKNSNKYEQIFARMDLMLLLVGQMQHAAFKLIFISRR